MPKWLLPAVIVVAGSLASAVWAADLPEGFVYLSDVDPTVAQDIRYAGADNFTHAVVPGYGAGECILTEDTAQALAAVQSELSARGFGLLVYDCYRPARAVKRFVDWASQDGPNDPAHNPRIARDRLLAEGYISRRSGHSSGGTVDLTLTRGGRVLDMGTGFDLFDPMAHTDNSKIPAAAKANRKLLIDAMTRNGFDGYKREWWHFRYRHARFAGKIFDFDILPKAR